MARPTRSIAIFICLVAALALSFAPNSDLRFTNSDPLLFISSFNASRLFGSLWDLQSFAFGQSFGAFQFPTILDPTLWVFALSHQSVPLTFYFAIVATFFGTLVYYYALRRQVFVGIAVAFVTCTVLFNLQFSADFVSAIAPNIIAQLGLIYLTTGLMMIVGANSVVWMTLLFAFLFYVVISGWAFGMLTVPVIGLSLLALAVPLSPKRRALVGVLFLLACGLFFVSGVYAASDSFTLMSARLWRVGGNFPAATQELKRSMLIFGGWDQLPYARTVGFLGIAGLLYHVIARRDRMSIVALLTLIYVAALIFLDVQSAGYGVYWSLPEIGYFERTLIPLYVVFAGSALSYIIIAVTRCSLAVWRPASQKSKRSNTSDRSRVAAALAQFCISVPTALAVVVLAAGPYDNWQRYLWRSPPYWDRLEKFVGELRLPTPSGSDFSPTFLDATKADSINNCFHLLDGNEIWRYCAYMINLLTTRNVLEFHNLIDVQIGPMDDQVKFAAFTYLKDAGDSLARRLIKSYGIRYVAMDGDVNDGKPLSLGNKTASLIDLGPIGASDLSVDSVVYKPVYNLNEVLAARHEGKAVVHDQLLAAGAASLVPIDSFSLKYEPDGVALTAHSAGDSIMLLPFQFSNCLSMIDDAGHARLLRVNGGQAALHFTNTVSARIRNEFTYFGNTNCRYRDFADVFRIGLWPRQSYDVITAGLRVPFVMRLYLQSRLRQRDRLLEAKRLGD